VRIVEKENSVTLSDTKIVWCDEQICEERGTDGATVVRRAAPLGEQVDGNLRFFATDHLGSVTGVTNGSAAVLGRYEFDPSGRRSLATGSDSTTVGFTGHVAHAPSGTHLALYRAYDSNAGRWVSEDPLGFEAGPNSYAYVENRPIVALDQLGLFPKKFPPFRTRPCNGQESATCAATCKAQGKGVESCRVSQTFRITRVTDRDGVVKILRQWVDGPMSCSCTDPDEDKGPKCGPNCVQMLVVLGFIVRVAIFCATRVPILSPA